MNIIEETLIKNLEKFDLIDKKLVIGFSGGGDSTSLIIALNELKKRYYQLNFEAFHVNYGLRKDSNKDQKFVENICTKLEYLNTPYANINKDYGNLKKQLGKLNKKVKTVSPPAVGNMLTSVFKKMA